MPGLIIFWIEATAIVTVVLLLPVYMGIIHVAPGSAALYAAAGGLAMAVGETLQFGARLRDLDLWEIGLWSATIAVTGGTLYVLALILI